MNYSNWKVFRLGDIALINAKSISSKYTYQEIEYIDTSSVTSNEFSQFQKIRISDAPSRAKRIVQHGDTIISTVRPIQRHFGFIRNPKPNTIASTGFAVITPKKINPEFLYYYLSQETITNYLNGIAETSTTTFPAFRPEVLSDLEIMIPEDEITQRRIAEILSVLDDKIELNRQTNATLEAIAQAIFKEWFVNFNFPGATGKMVDSELGMIPKGWRAGKLIDCVDIRSGKGLKHTEFTKTGYLVLGANGPIGYTDQYLVDEQVILTGRVGTLGTFQLVNKKVWISDNVLIIRPIKKEFYYPLYFCLKLIDFQNMNRGSTQPLVTKTDLLNQPLIIPETSLVWKYDKLCRALFNQIDTNQLETTYLTNIRDALLPKLMTGEIEV